jgi:hypothetical protein
MCVVTCIFTHTHTHVVQGKYQEVLDQIRLEETNLTKLQMGVNEEKVKLKAQRTLYEHVRADRNLFSKQQIQSEVCVCVCMRECVCMSERVSMSE